jgi:hypothetical protein
MRKAILALLVAFVGSVPAAQADCSSVPRKSATPYAADTVYRDQTGAGDSTTRWSKGWPLGHPEETRNALDPANDKNWGWLSPEYRLQPACDCFNIRSPTKNQSLAWLQAAWRPSRALPGCMTFSR